MSAVYWPLRSEVTVRKVLVVVLLRVMEAPEMVAPVASVIVPVKVEFARGADCGMETPLAA